METLLSIQLWLEKGSFVAYLCCMKKDHQLKKSNRSNKIKPKRSGHSDSITLFTKVGTEESQPEKDKKTEKAAAFWKFYSGVFFVNTYRVILINLFTFIS